MKSETIFKKKGMAATNVSNSKVILSIYLGYQHMYYNFLLQLECHLSIKRCTKLTIFSVIMFYQLVSCLKCSQ